MLIGQWPDRLPRCSSRASRFAFTSPNGVTWLIPLESPRCGDRLPYYLPLLLVIVFFSLIRWHFRYIPLERDEGEYAYAGQLMLHGIPPYTLIYSMKLPGTFAAYAAILLVFGQTAKGVHLGLLVVNAVTTFLIFLLGKRLFGPLAGLVAGSSYALLSTSPVSHWIRGARNPLCGVGAVSGVLLLLNAAESRRTWLYFWSGLFLGLAFLMKQPGIMFAVFGGLYLVKAEWQTWLHKRPEFWMKIALFAGGSPVAIRPHLPAVGHRRRVRQFLVLDFPLCPAIRHHRRRSAKACRLCG